MENDLWKHLPQQIFCKRFNYADESHSGFWNTTNKQSKAAKIDAELDALRGEIMLMLQDMD